MQLKSTCLLVLLCISFGLPKSVFAQDLISAAQKNKNLKILLISDLNDNYGSVTYSKEVAETVAKIKALKPDLILCAGDMVAGQKQSLTPEQIHAMWQGFDETVMLPIARLNIPFAFTIGNHDASPNFLKERQAASTYWNNNKSKTGLTIVDDAHYPYFFSYIKNNVFIISWDASSAKITDEVREWLTQQLNTDIAKKARYRIVMGHLPLYAIVESKNKPGEVLADPGQIEVLFKSLKVDMYISGHQHAYFPAQAASLTLLHAGCLGGGPRPLIGHSAEAQKAYVWIEIPKENPEKKLIIKGFNGATGQEINQESLPKTVVGFNGTVNRKN